ncbi:MAG: hypothetical protein RL112_2996, partial [Planctomycetota bacterium]
MAQTITGIDIGARGARFLRGKQEKQGFVVLDFH